MNPFFLRAFTTVTLLVAGQAWADPLRGAELRVAGVGSHASGTLYVALYRSKADFLRSPTAVCSAPVERGSAECVIGPVEPGEYAVSAFLDLNGNGELDTSWLGIPKEPVGASNEAKGRFGPPAWSDARFTLSDGLALELKLACPTSCLKPESAKEAQP